MSDDKKPLTDAEEKQLFHDLKIIASIKSRQRFTTNGCRIYIQPADDPWQGLWRFITRQDRQRNLKDVEFIMDKAFRMIEFLFSQKEILEKNSEQSPSRTRRDILMATTNDQKIRRLRASIEDVLQNIDGLSETYRDDTNTVAKIQVLKETIRDKLEQIDVSTQCVK